MTDEKKEYPPIHISLLRNPMPKADVDKFWDDNIGEGQKMFGEVVELLKNTK